MNIAMISKWHVHAEEYANALKGAPGCTVTAVWHDDEAVGRAWAEQLGARFVPNLDDILSDPEIGAVAVNAPTSDHASILIRAARAGKAIFTEKVLTLTREDALAVREAVVSSGKPFAISLPHKCRPELQFAKQLLDEGRLGRIGYARVRNVHDGSVAEWLPAHFYDEAQCGGGAMIDLGAHPMYTLAWLLGRPESVQSCFTNLTNKPVEDNAVCMLRFPGEAIGVSETGFVSRDNPYTLEISGTEGALMIHNGLTYCCAETDHQWVQPKKLPNAQPLPVLQWAEAIQTGAQLPEFGIDEAVLLTEIMQAAYLSHNSGKVATI